jgi:hypothetical protein
MSSLFVTSSIWVVVKQQHCEQEKGKLECVTTSKVLQRRRGRMPKENVEEECRRALGHGDRDTTTVIGSPTTESQGKRAVIGPITHGNGCPAHYVRELRI